jgi:hypothetical protein
VDGDVQFESLRKGIVAKLIGDTSEGMPRSEVVLLKLFTVDDGNSHCIPSDYSI